jgi:hypothetical protein
MICVTDPERRHNPSRVETTYRTSTQGSSVRAGLANLATLGFGTESLWDSPALTNLLTHVPTH